jgi:hypothetical protein
MHARPQIREILIARKMRHWCMVAKYPLIDRTCPPARARRNFWKLCQRYPELMRKLGLTPASVYQ